MQDKQSTNDCLYLYQSCYETNVFNDLDYDYLTAYLPLKGVLPFLQSTKLFWYVLKMVWAQTMDVEAQWSTNDSDYQTPPLHLHVTNLIFTASQLLLIYIEKGMSKNDGTGSTNDSPSPLHLFFQVGAREMHLLTTDTPIV